MKKRRKHDAGFKTHVALAAVKGERTVMIDTQFLETPFFGVQQMTWHLQNEDHAVTYKRIRRLMG